MLVAAVVSLAIAGSMWAQDLGMHYRHSSDMPPGAIGRAQLLRGGPLPGYFQPVEIKAPAGAMISLATGGAFQPPQPAPRKVGFLIGKVYRLRVTHIPRYPGAEVFPSIEVIDRLYPPPGQQARFPIPVQLTQAELVSALEGKMVTRVIYLENPQQALPVREEDGNQNWFEVQQGEDPLRVADLLGRPVAILRMGARIPDRHGPDDYFLHGSPPWHACAEVAPPLQPKLVPPGAAPPAAKDPFAAPPPPAAPLPPAARTTTKQPVHQASSYFLEADYYEEAE